MYNIISCDVKLQRISVIASLLLYSVTYLVINITKTVTESNNAKQQAAVLVPLMQLTCNCK